MTRLTPLRPFLRATLDVTHFDELGDRYEGKVRDVYVQERRNILIATDRQSAFDVHWCSIPLKGQILNQISSWWFKQIDDLMPTQVLAVPDPNVMVVKRLQMFKIEIIVRGYLTGSTETSVWTNYSRGVRSFCGNTLSSGMIKNERFTSPIITPTTKGVSDEAIDPREIVACGLATKEEWTEISNHALALFRRGQELAARQGLILVDTKYEMGKDETGRITIGDEVHTPDSSRYWIQNSYDERMKQGKEPESLDKEFFRLWLREQGFDYGKPKPEVTDEIRLHLAEKYLQLFEQITGLQFVIPTSTDAIARIEQNLQDWRV